MVDGRVGERRAVAGRRERRHGALRIPLGLVGLAGHEQVARHAREALPQRHRVAHPLVELGRRATRLDRLAEAVRVVELPAVGVEDLGALALAEPVDVREHGLEVRERLPVRAGAHRLSRRVGPGGDDRLDVARLHRVVHQARQLGPRLGAQAADDREVELLAPDRGQALLERPARELVAERHVALAHLQHAGDLGLGQRPEAVAEQPGGQLEADLGGHDGELLERRAAFRRQAADPRQHSLHHADGDRLARRGERLGDEERVAAGDAVEGRGVGAGARRQAPHGVARERLEREPLQRGADEHAEEPLHRMLRVELVVAAGEHEQRPERPDPPGGECQHVERGVVGPVDVLDHEHGRDLARQLAQQGGEHAVDRRAVGQRRRQRPVRLERDVMQRTERARRHQVVARREQHAPGGLGRERADEAGLADPGLPHQQDDRPAPRRGLADRRVQDAERGLALEQPAGHAANALKARRRGRGGGQIPESRAAWPSATVKRCS